MTAAETLYRTLAADLKKTQSPARYRHSLAVARLAGELAAHHRGWPPDRARLAGLLHDWAKEWSPKQLFAYARRHKLAVPGLDFIRKVNPNILHGYVGAHAVKENGWIRDAASLRAIASHTLGDLVMGPPEKILYIADLASYDRVFKEAPAIRKLAFEDLQLGYAASMALKMEYQLRKRKPLHPFVTLVWNRTIASRGTL